MDANYLPRVADTVLRDKLDAMGAVLIEDPKWCTRRPPPGNKPSA